MVIKLIAGLLVVTFILGPLLSSLKYSQWFITAEQQGNYWFGHGNFNRAAEAYRKPLLKGAAQYRAGDFEAAAASFAQIRSSAGLYNLGNALLMQGQYETAISSYQAALAKHPNWPAAQINLAIAKARLEQLKPKSDGEDQGTGGALEADDFVFDNAKSNNKQMQTIDDSRQKGLSEEEQQAMWLRKVQTQPADFLRSKFQYQASLESTGQYQGGE